MLPETAKTAYLESTHEDFRKYLDTWNTIADLREGAPILTRKAHIYCPQRPGESPELYKLRLQKFSYTPVMSDAIREFTSKLASAPVTVDGLVSDTFWAEWFAAVDGKDQDQGEFLTTLFSALLYFGRVLLAVDLPRVTKASRSALEDAKVNPYVTIFEPLQVTNWGDSWFLTRQVLTRNMPLADSKIIVKWTLWTDEEVAVYETEAILSSTGELSKYKLPTGQVIASSDGKVDVPKVYSWVHGLGKVPAVPVVLPLESWVGLNVYLKQLQHTRIEQSWTDAGIMAGTIQRVFTPTPPSPTDDPRYAFEKPDYSELQADNAHILIGSGFQFVESSGSAISSLTGQLETIEAQIKSLVSMGWMSVSSAGVAQSGVSKQVDFAILKDAMSAYGKRVAKVYEKALRLVTLAAKLPDEPSVSGLDSHEVNNLDSMLAASQVLLSMLPYIPQSAWKVWLGKLANLLTGSVSAEVKEKIANELETTANTVVTEPTEEPKTL